MGIGIIVCGLNGSGKSTLGKALAEKLEIHFIDIENLFFQQKASNYSSGLSRSDKEVEKILLNEVVTYKNFVFSAVKGEYGKDVLPFYNYAVLIDVPKEVRLERIKQRSLQKFGSRILPGGDMYEQEKTFYDKVSSRTGRYVEESVQSLECPVIRVDGTRSINENMTYITGQIQSLLQETDKQLSDLLK